VTICFVILVYLNNATTVVKYIIISSHMSSSTVAHTTSLKAVTVIWPTLELKQIRPTSECIQMDLHVLCYVLPSHLLFNYCDCVNE
jgi:hypothetical protein